MKIKYASSNGKEYNLIGKKMRITDGNFHSYEWTEDTTDIETGSKLYGFKKEPAIITLVWTFRGLLDKRKSMMDDITDSFEHDVINLTPGRFWYGKYYIDGYVKKSSTKKSSTWNNWTDVTTEIYCHYPYWTSETTYDFHSFGVSSDHNKKYPGQYPYRYANGMTSNYIINPHFADSNFDLIIFGPVVNPQVIIGETPYLTNIVLDTGEYIKIDSRAGTVTKVMVNGEIVNAFHNRQKGRQFFKKIPPGRHAVSWPGSFDWDLIIYEERSVPKWNVSQQQ